MNTPGTYEDREETQTNEGCAKNARGLRCCAWMRDPVFVKGDVHTCVEPDDVMALASPLALPYMLQKFSRLNPTSSTSLPAPSTAMLLPSPMVPVLVSAKMDPLSPGDEIASLPPPPAVTAARRFASR
ncbi:hypothetical protein AV530_007965 [Patagioenas fasciata monilis]|uniref:Uncharacterized protein n=1 Tax=Patagioenas fasciata monilis TaxID=372326 RepID=A0A1V4KTX4_PATFA|nr:hypothetical protein AV530_007965 [Patagioenas fasciata monilis]